MLLIGVTIIWTISSAVGRGDDPSYRVRFRLVNQGDPAARVSIALANGKFLAPTSSILRKTSRGAEYFYTDGEFEVQLPAEPVRVSVSSGLESVPVSFAVHAVADCEVVLHCQSWINMQSRGWYSGDSHIHLHTGGPIITRLSDASLAARAERLHFSNLCVSNNIGDDIRDADLITGQPASGSRENHLLVFGEEMRSSIYGHMQFFGIQRLVEPQYTGFDNTPNHLDYPCNYPLAKAACDQGGVVTYGHPMLKNSPDPFGTKLTEPNGAARELPIDAALGVVHAIDLMSYNCDKELTRELWYRLLNCGHQLAACVGTDALLDQSTDPVGGSRCYVQMDEPFTMKSWLDGLRQGRSFVTNGPVINFTVDGRGPGARLEADGPHEVMVRTTVESLVPVSSLEIVVNGEVVQSVPLSEVSSDRRVFSSQCSLRLERSSWIAACVRGPDDERIFDGPAFAHTSPVYFTLEQRPVRSLEDATYFHAWIEQLLRVVATRDRYPTIEDRKSVEALFRQAQEFYASQMASK